MAVLTIGDQFPAYELTAVVPGNLKDVAADKPEAYFTTVSSEVPEGTWRVVFFWPKDFTFVCPTEIAAFGKLNDDFADRDTLRHAFRASVSHDVSEFAHRITQPTLLVAAERDDITPIEKERELAQRFGDATLVEIPQVGHLVHYETPGAAARAIAEFLGLPADAVAD